MTIAEQVAAFLREQKPAAFCDECIRERLKLNRVQQVQRSTSVGAASGGFIRVAGVCSNCRKNLTVTNVARLPMKWRFWSAVGAVSAALGLYVYLYPWIQIERDFFYNPKDPFSASFYVQNDGFIPLTKISALCNSSYQLRPSINITDNITHTHEGVLNRLGHGERQSISCDSISRYVTTPSHLDKGTKLAVIVLYRFLGFPRNQTFHFTLGSDATGQYHWRYSP
jgi:hypothetical protein